MRLVRNALIYLVGGIATAGGSVMLMPVYASLLGPRDFGDWSIMLTMVQLLQAPMSWGLQASIVRFGITDHERPNTVRSSLAIASGGNLLITSIIYVTISTFDNIFGLQINPNTRFILYCAPIVCASQSYISILLGYYNVSLQPTKYRVTSLTSILVQVITFLIATTLHEPTGRLAIFCWTISSCLVGCCAIAMLVPLTEGSTEVFPSKKVLQYGIPVSGYTLIGNLNETVSKLIIVKEFGPVGLGVYTKLLSYTSVTSLAASAVNLAWVPEFYRNAEKWLKSYTYSIYCKSVNAAAAAITVILILNSPLLERVFSVEKSAYSSITLVCLALSAWLSSSVWTGFSNPLFFHGRMKLIMSFSCISTGTTIFFAALMVPLSGLPGVALANLIGVITLIALAIVTTQRYRHTRDMARHTFLLSAIIIAASFLSSSKHNNSSQNILQTIAVAILTLCTIVLATKNQLVAAYCHYRTGYGSHKPITD